MAAYNWLTQCRATQVMGIGLAAACLSYCLHARPSVIHARTRQKSASSAGEETEPYPQDVFPGGRVVSTPYGTMQVFEWGPEHGEKVLLVHGIGTPCIALGDMARQFVARGCRVLLFDLFGRGYSDGPGDLPYDARLYTSQMLLALASSPLAWTGAEAFHLVGYSLGAALSAAFAAYCPHALRSATLVCPGGLVRPSHVGWASRLLCLSEAALPGWLFRPLGRWRLRPSRSGPSADMPVDDVDADNDVDFDEVPLSSKAGSARVGDVMRWQVEGNDAFAGAYASTLRHAPIYGDSHGVWRRLGAVLAERRTGTTADRPGGLPSGRVCLVLASRDPVVVADECVEDARRVLGPEGVDVHVMRGGHEIAITRGRDVADVAMRFWGRGTEEE